MSLGISRCYTPPVPTKGVSPPWLRTPTGYLYPWYPIPAQRICSTRMRVSLSSYPDRSAQSVAVHPSTIKLPLGARNDRFGTHRSNALRAIVVAGAALKALLVTKGPSRWNKPRSHSCISITSAAVIYRARWRWPIGHMIQMTYPKHQLWILTHFGAPRLGTAEGNANRCDTASICTVLHGHRLCHAHPLPSRESVFQDLSVYVFDLWVEWCRKRHARGNVIFVHMPTMSLPVLSTRQTPNVFLRILEGRFVQRKEHGLV